MRKLLTWGNNSQGELGRGTCCIASNPVPTQVTSLASVSQVAVGSLWMLAVGTQASPPPPPFAVVPDLSGDSRAQASQALQAAGLVLGTVPVAAAASGGGAAIWSPGFGRRRGGRPASQSRSASAA